MVDIPEQAVRASTRDVTLCLQYGLTPRAIAISALNAAAPYMYGGSARDQALEEAAQVICDGCRQGHPINSAGYHDRGFSTYPCHAAAIRALKSQPAQAEAVIAAKDARITAMEEERASLVKRMGKQLSEQLDRAEALEADNKRLREALGTSEAAISEFYRYQYGGEMRGSYDGKPERDGLWKAMYKARAALGEVTNHGDTSS